MCFFTILLPRITLNSVKCKNAYNMNFAKQPILLVSETNTNHINLTLNIYCHTRLHLGFSANLRILQVPKCKMEPRSGNIFCKNQPDRPTDRPTDQPVQFKELLLLSMLCGVPTPIVPLINKVCAVPPTPPCPNCSPNQESRCGVPPPMQSFAFATLVSVLDST